MARPSHVLLAAGADPDRARSSLRFSLGHTSTDADVDAVLASSPRWSSAPAEPGWGGGRRELIAAMSGGVDSAVAAALAVEAGHDVTGVHLALSQHRAQLRSGSRGAAASRTPTTPAGSPVSWASRLRVGHGRPFASDVVDDFVAEYAAGRTPNPCLRCNEKIKFAAVLDRAQALGFDAVVTGHHARLADGQLRRSVDAAKDQSYVLGVLTAGQLAGAVFPLGSMTKQRVREIAAERGYAVATKPDSHDICFIPDGDTRGFLDRRLGEAPARWSTPPPARRWGSTAAPTASPSASARVWASPSATSGPATCSASSR